MKYGAIIILLAIFCYGFREFPVAEKVYIKSGYELLYGEHYMYQMKTPEGYKPAVQLKSIFQGHIKFLPIQQDMQSFEFYVVSKTIADSSKLLNTLMQTYQSDKTEMQVQEIASPNIPYECKAKLFSVQQKSFDYMYCIDCGDRFNYWIVVHSHADGRPLDVNALAVLDKTIATINPIK